MNETMKCVITAGGRLDGTPAIERVLQEADLIVCADSGARHLRAMKILPHVVIGDMDSISPDDINYFESRHVPFQHHPPQKNATDMELCMQWAIQKGADRITFLGAVGTRMDHTLANIFLLKVLAEKNIHAKLMDAHNEIYLTTDTLTLEGTPGDLLSLIPVTETATGITIEGLAYPLKDAEIKMGDTIGISNVFQSGKAEIRIRKGMLLVTKSRD